MADLSLGIVYKSVGLGDTFVLIPSHLCYGKYDNENDVFFDILSDRVIVNATDALDYGYSESFGEHAKVNDLKKIYRTLSLREVMRKYMVSFKTNLKVLNGEKSSVNEYVFEEVSPEDYFASTGIKVAFRNQTEMFNEIIESRREKQEFLEGKATDEVEEEVSEEEVKVKLEKISVLCEKLRAEIINQDEQIKKIITAIYKNLAFDDVEMKSNILIYGPSGVGKTQILKSLSKLLGVPLWIEDVTKYTEAGYKGGDVEDILYNVYINAKGNIDLAQRSILVLDEIDKKAGGGDMDVTRGGVLKSLLSIIEGGTFPIYDEDGNLISFDTSKLTIIACGAFTDLRESVSKSKKSIGFGISEENEAEEGKLEIKDFVKYGMPLEFMGRFRTIIKMNSLSKDDLVRILKESTISPLMRYKRAFESIGLTMDLDEATYEVIANKAIRYNTGGSCFKCSS